MKQSFKNIFLKVLEFEARQVLKRRKPFIIGISGNIGKTSTKDAIFDVLEKSFDVRKTEKSMNSEFGVPLTILGLKSPGKSPARWIYSIVKGFINIYDGDYPDYLVLEFGADKKGDIKKLCEWIKLDIAIVTHFGSVPVHIENFASREELVDEEAEILNALKEGGVYVGNLDDHDSVKIGERRKDVKKYFVSTRKSADYFATHIGLYGEPILGTMADVFIDNKKFHLTLPGVVGISPVYASLFGIAVGDIFEIDNEAIIERLVKGHRPPGRMKLLPGINNSSIIDDSYNASPKAMEHGLDTLGSIDCKRKIALLGDMLELGNYSRDEHYKMGKVVAKHAHILVTSGIRARVIAEGALDAGMNESNILECDTSILAGKELVKLIKPGDVIYCKGSQGARIERAVKMILRETHDPKSYLVRQDRDWQ